MRKTLILSCSLHIFRFSNSYCLNANKYGMMFTFAEIFSLSGNINVPQASSLSPTKVKCLKNRRFENSIYQKF